MYTGEIQTQAILRCGLCNKPFDKQSSLKRHGYYCRSRRTGSTVRSRSCLPCAKSKARCDNRRPECSRCVSRAGQCRYPASEGTSRGKKTPSLEDSTSNPSIPSSVENQVSSQLELVLFDDETTNASTNADLGLSIEVGGEYLAWDDLDIDFTDLLNQPINMDLGSNMSDPKNFRYPSPSTSIPAHSATPPHPPSQINATNTASAIPSPMAHLPRLLIPRPNPKPGAQRITTLIQHTLKSYLTLLQHDALPPFIHPLSVAFDENGSGRQSPLSKSIDWIRTTSSESTGRQVFWGNVRVECEQLCAEYSKFDKWDLLSAMQALAFYLLVRIDEGETEHNNLDFLLLATVTVLAKQLTWDGLGALLPHSQIQNQPNVPSELEIDNAWRSWVVEESRRRLAVIYRIINMLVYFEPAARCDLPKDLVLAPLPAKKQLWEATGASTWKQEVEREPGAQTAFGLAITGELVRFEIEREAEDHDVVDVDVDTHKDGERRGARKQEKVLTRHEDLLLHKSTNASGKPLVRSAASWEEWCEGMDGFGGIVLLVASLIA